MSRQSNTTSRQLSVISGGKDKTARRNRGPYHRWRTLLTRLGVVAAVLLVLFLGWRNWDKIAPEALLDWTDQQFGNGEAGEGYPYTIAGNSVINMGQVSNHLVLLTDTSLQFLNSSAARVANRSHPYSDPTLQTAGKYALITEIGGNRFQLETRRGTVVSSSLDNRKIYSSALLSSGKMAFVTNAGSQSYLSEVHVLNSNGEAIYEYKSTKYLMTGVALAPNGKGMAVIGTTAEAGALKSVLLLFDFSEAEPVEYAGKDVLLFEVSYFRTGTVLAVGDTEYWTLKDDKLTQAPYSGMELIGYDHSEYMAGLVVRQAGSTGTGSVWLIDFDGKLTKSNDFTGAFRSVSCDRTEVLVLTDEELLWFDSNKATGQCEVAADSLMVSGYNRSAMVLTLSQLTELTKS